MPSFRGFLRNVVSTITHAVAHPVETVREVVRPERLAPPPLPTAPPPPPRPAPRREREVSRRPRETAARPIPRADLPRDWGRNQSALWQDATRGSHDIGYDATAQAFYDAALYTFAESHEDRAAILENFKQYIMDVYGIDWDDIFDWEDYRQQYDANATAR